MGRHRWARCTTRAALVALLVLAPAGARAQAGDTPLARLHHTTWAQADTLMLGGSRKVLRSPDGYLWLSHALGLVRFDGVRFTLLDGAHAPALRSGRAGAYLPRLVDRGGTLWIARPDGALVTYRDGAFAVAVPAERGAGSELVEDAAGRLWVWRRGGSMQLSRWRDGRLERAPLPAGLPDTAVLAIVADTGGGLWIGTREDGLWHLANGRARAVRSRLARDEDMVRPLLQARDGALWALGTALGPGVYRLLDDRWTPVTLDGGETPDGYAREAVEDRDGTVWIATVGSGVLRWRDGRLEQYATRDGLSDMNAQSVLVDEEGSTWITTDAALDRLRPSRYFTLSERQGLPFLSPSRMVEDRDGRIWAQAHGGGRLFRVDGERLRAGRGSLAGTPVATPPGETGFQLLAAAGDGGAWVAPYLGGLARVDARGVRRLGAATGVPRARFALAHETRDGTLWAAILRGGFGRLRDGRYAPVALPDAGVTNVAALAEDDRGHLWVSLADRPRVYELRGDGVVRGLDEHDGLGEALDHLAAERGDTLWGIGGETLVRIAGGRVSAIPASAIAHVLQARAQPAVFGGRLWIASEAGILHLELAALHRIADGAAEPLAYTAVTALDGVPVPKTPAVTPHPVSYGGAGQMWLSTPAGVMVVDRTRAAPNAHPPRVHVEELLVAGRRVATGAAGAAGAAITIGPRPDRVDLRFTATSLLVPERVRLEYMLEGADAAWRAAGTPRLATSTQLRPGRYRFRVRAWNEDGVPSAQEARLAFRVLPMWYQTWWFAALGLLAVAASGAGGVLAVQRARGRRRAEAAEARFQATLDERTRLARELHDTLLQGFTGITLQLQAVRGTVERAPGEAARALDRVLGVADATLRDARQTVWDMLPPELDGRDVGDALAAAARGVAADTGVALHVAVTGERRPLPPAVETAALRIGREAMANAVRHARARDVSLEVAYEPRGLRLRVRDDGVGLDAAAAEDAASHGHLGVRTMRERAARAGGVLEIASAPGRGTEVSVFLPADGAP